MNSNFKDTINAITVNASKFYSNGQEIELEKIKHFDLEKHGLWENSKANLGSIYRNGKIGVNVVDPKFDLHVNNDIGFVVEDGKEKVFLNYDSEIIFKNTNFLTPSELSNGDSFGYSVSISAKIAVIGAPFKSKGYVYIYERNDDTQPWELTGTLSNSTYGYFGKQVAISNERIIINAPDLNISNKNTGALFIYQKTNNDWNLSKTVKNPDSEGNSNFAYNFDVKNNLIIISSKNNENTDSFKLYSLDITNLSNLPNMIPLSDSNNDYNSIFTIVTSTKLAVTSKDFSKINIFNLNNGVWSLENTSITKENDETTIGKVLSSSGNIIIATCETTKNRFVKVYDISDSNNIIHYKLTNSINNSNIGVSLSINDNNIFVGAPNDISSKESGNVFIHKKQSDETYSETVSTTLTAFNSMSNDRFGFSVGSGDDDNSGS